MMPKQEYRDKSNQFSLYFLITALISFVTSGLFMFCFRKVGEGLTYKLRVDSFRKMVTIPCEWYDQPENNPGSLATRLTSDAA